MNVEQQDQLKQLVILMGEVKRGLMLLSTAVDSLSKSVTLMIESDEQSEWDRIEHRIHPDEGEWHVDRYI